MPQRFVRPERGRLRSASSCGPPLGPAAWSSRMLSRAVDTFRYIVIFRNMFEDMPGFGGRWFRGPHGFGAGHFGMWMRHGKRRFRRGMLKHVLLRLIEEEPRHGYDLMKF